MARGRGQSRARGDGIMRFFWFHPSSHGIVGAPSTLLSVAAHAAFFGAAMYGTGPRSNLLELPSEQHLYYLPPPDRRPGHAPTVEHLQYVELGAGKPSLAAGTRADIAAGQPAAPRDRPPGGVSGEQATEEAAVAPLESPDSVYSVLSLEETATRVEGSAAPVFPPEMLEQGIEGRVRTRYVIDTTGRADSTSLQVLDATNDAFVLAVRAALPGMRFISANVQGRKVRQVVEQEFDFRITIPTPAGALAEHTRTTPVP